MTNREKIIKGLETCSIKTGALRCLECPYGKEERDTDKWCTRGLHRDILSLLKEQEPIKPKVKHFEFHYASYDEYENRAYCPKCEIQLIQQVNYCPRCGQAVKWE